MIGNGFSCMTRSWQLRPLQGMNYKHFSNKCSNPRKAKILLSHLMMSIQYLHEFHQKHNTLAVSENVLVVSWPPKNKKKIEVIAAFRIWHANLLLKKVGLPPSIAEHCCGLYSMYSIDQQAEISANIVCIVVLAWVKRFAFTHASAINDIDKLK